VDRPVFTPTRIGVPAAPNDTLRALDDHAGGDGGQARKAEPDDITLLAGQRSTTMNTATTTIGSSERSARTAGVTG